MWIQHILASTLMIIAVIHKALVPKMPSFHAKMVLSSVLIAPPMANQKVQQCVSIKEPITRSAIPKPIILLISSENVTVKLHVPIMAKIKLLVTHAGVLLSILLSIILVSNQHLVIAIRHTHVRPQIRAPRMLNFDVLQERKSRWDMQSMVDRIKKHVHQRKTEYAKEQLIIPH